MCTTCGCGQGGAKVEGEHGHVLPDGTVLRHVHGSGEGQSHSHVLGNGSVLSHAHPHAGPHAHEHSHLLPDGRVLTHSHDAEQAHEHTHLLPDGTLLTHSHAHDDQSHEHGHDHLHAAGHDHGHHHEALHFGLGPARTHAPGMSQQQMVRIERDILSKNEQYAARNRAYLAERGIFAVNLVSSPGSGKTTLVVRTIEALARRLPVTVIEGDQQTSHDAERIRAAGARAVQVNTGKGCHLDAAMVERALGALAPPEDSLLIIENVGNLVCPAAFDLGEAHKVVVLSVTEGEDKPLKYPDMFLAADLMVLNKVDLLPHLAFDVGRCVGYAQRVKPGIRVMQMSAATGEGFGAWLEWVEAGVTATCRARCAGAQAPLRRVAELEAELAKRG